MCRGTLISSLTDVRLGRSRFWRPPGSVAVRLDIRYGRVDTWELATRAGQDLRLLNDNEALGFDVDGGRAAFFDEAARDAALVDPRRLYDSLDELGYAELYDTAAGANVFAVNAIVGDGTYPTWIGRDAAGEVVCFVMDLEQLHQMVRDTHPRIQHDENICPNARMADLRELTNATVPARHRKREPEWVSKL